VAAKYLAYEIPDRLPTPAKHELTAASSPLDALRAMLVGADGVQLIARNDGGAVICCGALAECLDSPSIFS